MNFIGDIESCLNTSGVPFIVFDKASKIIHWNPAAHTMLNDFFEYIEKNPEGNFLTYLHTVLPPEKASHAEFLFNLKIGSIAPVFVLPNKKMGQRYLKFLSVRKSTGTRFVIIDDVTRQRVQERCLLDAKRDAENARSTSTMFLANVSHEIRTPIQTIIGMMELLSETPLDKEQTEYARQVRFSADVLLALVNDVLDFSKLSAGKMNIVSRKFNLINCIEQTVDLVSLEAHRKGLEVIIDLDWNIPNIILCDSNRLRQVLLNLVKNAVKFTEKGEVIVAVTQTTMTQNKKEIPALLFEVIDSGIGITEEQKEKLFSTFYQVSTPMQQKKGGTGLGLSISKTIISLLHGDIGVRNNAQGGSVFWFQIPLKEPENIPANHHISLDPETRFLIVDDAQRSYTVFERILTYAGFTHVAYAESGEQALKRMHEAADDKAPFDIVFIDMIMPSMDGWRLGAEIHNTPSLQQSQLYLLIPEGSAGADAKMKLLEWFNGYLYKPIKIMPVIHILEDISHPLLDVVEPLELLPLEPGDQPAPPVAHNKSNIHVLLAEDHPVNRKLLEIMLEKSGCTVQSVENGQEAVEAAAAADFDIFFMDIQMPVLGGYEATEILRNNGVTVPIIACTAGMQDMHHSSAHGMTDVLAKPFKRADLMHVLNRYFPQHFEGLEE